MKGLKGARVRIANMPFETAIALLLIVSGIVQVGGLGQPDQILDVLPQWEVIGLSILSIITGIFIVIGVSIASRRFELSGMFFLLAIFGVRLYLFATYLGINENFIVMGVFDLSILWAAIVRIVRILRGTSIVMIRGSNDIRI